MILKITDKDRRETYGIELRRITQLCGKNISKKTFIVDSLIKYFSSAKYMEYEYNMEENVEIDGEAPGRQYYEVFAVRSRADIINELKLKKTSMAQKYRDRILNDFDGRVETERIERSLNAMFDMLNRKFSEDGSRLKFTYREQNVIDMVSAGELLTVDEGMVESLSTAELLDEYLNVLIKLQEGEGNKRVLILENLDHILDLREYHSFMDRLKNAVTRLDLWCIVTSSIENYVFIDEEYFDGINCVNDMVYNMPEYEDVKRYSEFNYPINKVFADEEFKSILAGAVHNIGEDRSLYDIRSIIIERLINKSACVNVCRSGNITLPEKDFL